MSCKQVGQCSGRSGRLNVAAFGVGGLSSAASNATDVGPVELADIAQAFIDGTDTDEFRTTTHA